MKKLLVIVSLLAMVRSSYAGDGAAPGSYSGNGYGTASSNYGTLPGSYNADRTTVPAASAEADHLDAAAAHFEAVAAGLKDEAQRIRLLAKTAPAPSPALPEKQIIVTAHLLDLSLTKLRNLKAKQYGGSDEMTVAELFELLRKSKGEPVNLSSVAKLLALVEHLRKDNLITVLAEPTLSTVAGRPAWCLAGGEVGYQTKDANGNVTVGFKEYGTRLDITAQIADGDRISLDARIGVSKPDPANSIAGVPAFTSRGIETAVTLHTGETNVISGFMESRITAVESRADEEGNKSESTGRRSKKKEVHMVCEEHELLSLLKAEIEPKAESGHH